MSDRKQQFIQALLPYAQSFERKTGIPAAYALAMAANETGWNAANPVLFGIKGKSPSGKGGTFQTWEVEGGRRVDQPAQFATYNDPGEAFDHLAQNMASARYQGAPRGSAQAFASHLQKQGWATDPDYASKIARLAAEIGGQTGGSMPPNETAPQEDQYIAGLKKEAEAAETEAKQAEAALQQAQEAYEATLAAKQTPTPAQWQALESLKPQVLAARKAAVAARKRADDAEKWNYQQRGREQDRIETEQRKREADAAKAQASSADKAKQQELDRYVDYLTEAVKMGQLSETVAQNAFNRALQTMNQTTGAINSAQGHLLNALPKMGDKKLAAAAVAAVRGWNKFGSNIPEFELPTMNYDPMGAIQGYLPTPQQGQQLWQRAMAQSDKPAVDPTQQAQMLQAAHAGAGRDNSYGGSEMPTDYGGRTGMIPGDEPYVPTPQAQQPWQQGLLTPQQEQNDMRTPPRMLWQQGMSEPVVPQLSAAQRAASTYGAWPNSPLDSDVARYSGMPSRYRLQDTPAAPRATPTPTTPAADLDEIEQELLDMLATQAGEDPAEYRRKYMGGR